MEALFKGIIYLFLIVGICYIGVWWWDAENYGMRASVIDYNERELETFLQEDYGWGGMDILVDKAKRIGKRWHLNGKLKSFGASEFDKYHTFESVVRFCGHKDTYYASHMEVFEMLEFTVKDPEGNVMPVKERWRELK